MITNIIKLLLCIFTLCFFSFCKQNKQEKQEEYGDYSLLWKISSKGLTKPSYLFGTYHAENRFFLDSVPFLNQAFDSAEQFIYETVQLSKSVVDIVKMPQNITYEMLLKEADLLILDSISNKYNIKNAFMIKPDVLLVALQNEMMKKHLEYKMREQYIKNNQILDNYYDEMDKVINFATIDSYLLIKTKNKSCMRIGLDDICDQALKNISSDDSAALKISAEFLINCIKDPDTNIITPYEKEIAGYESQITEKPSFISVGVGHLPGEYGLINLLRKKGYKVEKVWNNKSNKQERRNQKSSMNLVFRLPLLKACCGGNKMRKGIFIFAGVINR
ncbi:MAG: TraB/GumN family protein [Dysgonamonadaceae bacterium]|jgi:uncharacterized protein YbaP (TraB family)|nr:TraB/GumN family protein [Dysgonamonadaceae bacterium]